MALILHARINTRTQNRAQRYKKIFRYTNFYTKILKYYTFCKKNEENRRDRIMNNGQTRGWKSLERQSAWGSSRRDAEGVCGGGVWH